MSQELHSQPWVIDDDERTTPHEWSNRMLMLMNCKAEASRIQESNTASQQRISRVRSGKGRFQ